MISVTCLQSLLHFFSGNDIGEVWLEVTPTWPKGSQVGSACPTEPSKKMSALGEVEPARGGTKHVDQCF